MAGSRTALKAAAMLALATAALCSGAASAQYYEGGNWKVVGYRVGADGGLFALSPAPQACGGGSNWGEHIKIADDAANHQEMFASLMTAYVTGEKLSGLWFRNSGPCDNATPLSVFMIRMASK